AIYKTVGTSNVVSSAGACGPGSPAINQSVKDVLIIARVDTIDGNGGILGQAGPCQIHPISGLTRLGTMRFDSTDINVLLGTGTVNSHWREPTFVNELMTGYINNGPNPASVVTIASLEDLGYTVNYGAADAYVHTFTSSPALRAAAAPLVDLHDDVYRGPI